MFGYWLLYEIGAELRRLRLAAGSSANIFWENLIAIMAPELVIMAN
jgi:hypothetical protein